MRSFRCQFCKNYVSEKELDALQRWALANGRIVICTCKEGEIKEEIFRVVQLPHKPSETPKKASTDG